MKTSGIWSKATCYHESFLKILVIVTCCSFHIILCYYEKELYSLDYSSVAVCWEYQLTLIIKFGTSAAAGFMYHVLAGRSPFTAPNFSACVSYHYVQSMKAFFLTIVQGILSVRNGLN